MPSGHKKNIGRDCVGPDIPGGPQGEFPELYIQNPYPIEGYGFCRTVREAGPYSLCFRFPVIARPQRGGGALSAARKCPWGAISYVSVGEGFQPSRFVGSMMHITGGSIHYGMIATGNHCDFDSLRVHCPPLRIWLILQCAVVRYRAISAPSMRGLARESVTGGVSYE